MSLPKVSPSRLDRIASCPRYVFDDRPQKDRDDAMDAGTRFHTLMENIAKSDNPALKINEIPDFMDRRAAEYAWLQVSGYIANGFVIDGVEKQLPESSVCRRGFADLILRSGKSLIVVDWKLTRAEGEHDMQMRAYAIAALESDETLESVRTVVIAPLIQHTDEMVIDRAGLRAQCEIVAKLMADVENPFTPAKPGDVCSGCKWAGRCPAQCRELVPVSIEAAMPVALGELLSPTTPEGRARRRYFADWLVSAVKGIKDDDLEFVKAGNEPPPGYKLISKAGASTIPAESVPDAINKLVAAGYPLEAIHASCKLYTSKLAGAMSEVLGESEDDLKKKMDDTIKDCYINGEPSVYLQRTSKKAMKDLFAATLAPKLAE